MGMVVSNACARLKSSVGKLSLLQLSQWFPISKSSQGILGQSNDMERGCHMMQVGPMWQANGNQYATKWQVSHRSISTRSAAVLLPVCASTHVEAS